MNKVVSKGSIYGYSLRIKTTNSDILYGTLESTKWSEDLYDPWVEFELPQNLLNRLVVGSFYKVQLAYIQLIGDHKETGYYSSVGIIKYTSQPTVSISDFSIDKVNNNLIEYVGVYENSGDPAEKVYQYRFNFYTNENVLLTTSGWKIHNSYEDDSLFSSNDSWSLEHNLEQNIIYKIEYEIITNNNLQFKSPLYLLSEVESIAPEAKINLEAKLNYENGCINLSLLGKQLENQTEYVITGSFLLSRASSKDNYTTWLPISRFKLNGERPSSFLLKDFTIEQGITYIYSLQQYHEKIYSNRILSNKIEANFEDIFLFDGKKQLRIRFNPKVTSFKTIYQENKKNTLGSKYPYIFRNGITAYKEFQVQGLISYFMDNDEFFATKEELLYDNHILTTDIIDKNIVIERLFKLKVMEWLGNGEPKLFRSPQEGNYIVRLMNTQFTPIDTTSRMIHNFSCNATEISEFTPNNLITYGFLDAAEVPIYQMRWKTIVFDKRQNEQKEAIEKANYLFEKKYYNDVQRDKKITEIQQKLYPLYGYDLLGGEKAYYIKISDMIMGSLFSFKDAKGNQQKIMIGVTGSYEFQSDDPITDLILINNNANTGDSWNNNKVTLARIRGQVTYGIKTASQNRFDTILNVYTQNIPVIQFFGPNDDILKNYRNLKKQITNINFVKFTKMDVVDIHSPMFFQETPNINGDENERNIILNGQPVDLSFDHIYDVQGLNENKEITHKYYRYHYNELTKIGTLYEEPHFITIPAGTVIIPLNAYTLYRYINEQKESILYRFLNDTLIQQDFNDYVIDSATGGYKFNYKDLNMYTIYHKQAYDAQGKFIDAYYKFDGEKIIRLDSYSTEVNYGNTNIDVGDIRVREIKNIKDIPPFISIGSGVMAELSIQLKIIKYSIEDSDDCEVEYLTYLNAAKIHRMQVDNLQLVENNNNLILGTGTNYRHYEVWDDENFSFRHFSELNSENLDQYKNMAPEVFPVYEAQPNLLYTKGQLNASYAAMIEAENIFIAKLEELLQALEEENKYV